MRLIPRALLLVGSLAASLAAQDTGFSINGGLISALDSLKKATNKSTAFQIGTDYHTKVWSTEVPARVGLTLASMPGSEWNGLKTSLTLAQLHGDLILDGPGVAWHPVLGLSVNHYGMKRTGVENLGDPDVNPDGYLDHDHHFPVRDVKGLKIGFRLGLDYSVSRNVELELMFQQTELAGKDLTDPQVRAGGINPAWFEFNVRYRF
jgi:hypothetical protein